MFASMTLLYILLILINRFGHCESQCTSLNTGTDIIYAQANGVASLNVTVPQPCYSSLESLTVVSKRDPPPYIPVCQLLIHRNGSCEPDNMCSCQPQQIFKIAGKVFNQQEVWIISGSVQGMHPSSKMESSVKVFGKATTITSDYESTTFFDTTSSFEKDLDVNTFNNLTNWLTLLASLFAALLLTGFIVMYLLYRRAMRKIRREGKLNALKMKQEYASSPSLISHTDSKEHQLYELAKDCEYHSDRNVYQDMPPAYSYALDQNLNSDLTLDQSSDEDLTSSLSSTASSVTDKQFAVSTDSEQYWQNYDHNETSSGSTKRNENEIHVYPLPFVSCSSLTVCSV